MMDRDFETAIDPFGQEETTGLPEFLKDPVRAIRRRWLWMLVALLLGLAATAVFGLTLKPSYRASATLLVSSQQIPEDFVRPTVRDDSLQRMSAMVGSILSGSNLSQLIKKHNLYPSLRERLPMSDVVEAMRDDVKVDLIPSVSPGRQYESASRYSISFTCDDPKTAADVANDLASVFTESSIERREQQARLTTEFLRRQLQDAERDLREQERMIREFKEKHPGELPDELEANLRKLEQLQSQRQSLAMQVAEAETRLATLVSANDPNSPEARLAALKSKLAEEISIHTDEHPNVRSLRRQIEALEASMKRDSGGESAPYPTRSALVAAERNTLTELRRQQQATEAELREIDARVANTPKRQEELGGLEEKASVLRDNYRDFLRKVQEAELAQNLESAQQGERVEILDRAAPPATPTKDRIKYVLAGIVASFGFSLGIGFLLELADPVVVSPEHAETALGLRVLGSVYRIT
jgi:succinoglycan biosynthesis transport protein ExoP